MHVPDLPTQRRHHGATVDRSGCVALGMGHLAIGEHRNMAAVTATITAGQGTGRTLGGREREVGGGGGV